MFNNTYYPYNLQAFTGYRIIPIGKIEETSAIYPDLQGNPMFFFDQSRNEIYVKQRKTHTGEVETLKYTLSGEQIKPTKTQNSYDEQFNALRRDIERINDVLGVKIKKEAKDVQED